MEANPNADESPQSAKRPNNKQAKKTTQIATRKRAGQKKTYSGAHIETPYRYSYRAKQYK
jgi:hypothetical protein